MSADNRILIFFDKQNDTWYEWHFSISINYYEPPHYVNNFLSEQDTLNWTEFEYNSLCL